MCGRRDRVSRRGARCLASCASDGNSGEAAVDQLLLTPLPTVAGVGVLPDVVPPERAKSPSCSLRRSTTDGTVSEPIGEQITGNRVLVIGDSIMASTATRYTGYMCDELVPLGWAVEVEAEPSRFIDFGNRRARQASRPRSRRRLRLRRGGGPPRQQLRRRPGTVRVGAAPDPRPAWRRARPCSSPSPSTSPTTREANESIRKLAAEFENVTLLDWEQVVEVSRRAEHRSAASDRRPADTCSSTWSPKRSGRPRSATVSA